MFAQPLTDAFRPTIKPPDTAESDVVGSGGEVGGVGVVEAGGGDVAGVDPGPGVDRGSGAGMGVVVVDPGRGGCDCGRLVDFTKLGGA
jgi:hypothetical protein